MKPFTSPRARRPLKARVTAVPLNEGSVRADLWTSEAPLSALSRKAVPELGADRSRPDHGGHVRPRHQPPGGHDRDAHLVADGGHEGEQAPASVGGPVVVERSLVAASLDSLGAHRVSTGTGGEGGLGRRRHRHHHRDPTRWSWFTICAEGLPKVKLTTGTGFRRNHRSFSSHPSSSQLGTTETPKASASDRRLFI